MNLKKNMSQAEINKDIKFIMARNRLKDHIILHQDLGIFVIRLCLHLIWRLMILLRMFPLWVLVEVYPKRGTVNSLTQKE